MPEEDAVQVTAEGLSGMVTLRGDLGDAALQGTVTGLAGTAFPPRRGIRWNGAQGAAWMAPDELLLFMPHAAAGAAVARLDAALAGRHHLAVDVSDARAMFRLSGGPVREVLAKLAPADLSPAGLPPGELRRTRLGQVAAAFWIGADGGAGVLCFRSVAAYMAELLEDAARPAARVGYFGRAAEPGPPAARSGRSLDARARRAQETAATQFPKRKGHAMAFELPDLPYSHDALADMGMSRETLEYHHDIHHNAYVNNGNKAIQGTEWEGKPVEEIVKGTFDPKALAQSGIFNNASQHWNHSHFWKMMAPGKKGIPGSLEKRLSDAFGSVDEFKDAFKTAGGGQFGSGWAWLVVDTDGNLKVTKTPNGVNPLCFGQTALLGVDVWEHSYYIDFRNKRPAYLQNFVDHLVNWEYVEERLSKA